MITDVEVREAGSKGLGVFARRPFAEGEFILRRRHAREVRSWQLEGLSAEDRMHLCELDVDRFAVLAPPGCYLNHSCDPSAMRHGVVVFAWRPIEAGEEVTVDYRLNALDGDSWSCRCGTEACTGVVGGGGFFGMSEERQRLLLPHAPAFIRREHRRRRSLAQ